MAAAEENGTRASMTGLTVMRRGSCGDIVLEGPQTRNALSSDMVEKVREAYPAFARDAMVYAVLIRSTVNGVFSDGSLSEWSAQGQADLPGVRRRLAELLQLCWLHECFSKPTVSLVDGLVSGSGHGVSLYGTHRVGGAAYRWRLPEVRHGLVPGCGVLHALSRMPDSVGLYLALTGRSIGRADALYLGLVTHCIDVEHFETIAGGLAEADPVDPLLDKLHVEQPTSSLHAEGARIRRYFEGGDVGAIITRLEAAPAEDRIWAEGVLADLRLGAPTAMRVTARAIREARMLDLRAVLVLDYRLGHRLFALPDFQGDRAPSRNGEGVLRRWRPVGVREVSDGMVDGFFAPLDSEELVLKTRAEMQAARV